MSRKKKKKKKMKGIKRRGQTARKLSSLARSFFDKPVGSSPICGITYGKRLSLDRIKNRMLLRLSICGMLFFFTIEQPILCMIAIECPFYFERIHWKANINSKILFRGLMFVTMKCNEREKCFIIFISSNFRRNKI